MCITIKVPNMKGGPVLYSSISGRATSPYFTQVMPNWFVLF